MVWLLFLTGVWSDYGAMVCSKSQSVKIIVDQDLVNEFEWVGDLLETSADCEVYNNMKGWGSLFWKILLDFYMATVLARYVDKARDEDNFKRVTVDDQES